MDEPLNIDFISEITWANYKIAKEAERIKGLEERGSRRTEKYIKGLGSLDKSK